MNTVTALERRAVAAAAATAAAYGIEPAEALVVHSGSNVLVRLGPAPVVARVMTGTVALHDDPQRWLQRELSVLEFLAPSGRAVVPSRLIAPGPHCHDDLWLTFTEWVRGVEPPLDRGAGVHVDDARRFGLMLRQLHEDLRTFDGALGGLRDLRDDIRRLLGRVRPTDTRHRDAIVSLGERLDALETTVFGAELPAQALHGDVSLRNVLRTPQQRLWNDFEDTFRGPVHWDVASAAESLRMHGAAARAVRAMLDAYGWVDERELDLFIAAQDVYGEIWRLYDRQRRAQRPMA